MKKAILVLVGLTSLVILTNYNYNNSYNDTLNKLNNSVLTCNDLNLKIQNEPVIKAFIKFCNK